MRIGYIIAASFGIIDALALGFTDLNLWRGGIAIQLGWMSITVLLLERDRAWFLKRVIQTGEDIKKMYPRP